MREIPRAKGFDNSWAVVVDPYRYISRQCRRLGSDIFQSRFLLQPVICMTGADAARLFYDPQRFQRGGAAPGRVIKTLFGVGAVQTLDGEAHRHRKQLLLDAMQPARVEDLVQLFRSHCLQEAERWQAMRSVELYAEFRRILTRSVCQWAGVPLAERDVERRTRQLTAMFESAGSVGLRHWHGRLARRQAERWIADYLGRIRAGQESPPPESAAAAFAAHRDLNEQLLEPSVAAVELLNVLRPVVAVSVYVVLVALALHEQPACRERILAGEPGFTHAFVQEVRRFYPFFPAVLARVREDFQWRGYHFPQGMRVMLDLYGTNHDERLWPEPERFLPERFLNGEPDRFSFVPQGGGDAETGHRCAGEHAAVSLMQSAAEFLTCDIAYRTPPQGLRVDMRHMPALPRSRMRIENVERVAVAERAGGLSRAHG